MGKALDYKDKSDENLMVLIAAKDHGAAAALIFRHQRGLLNLFYRYTNDRLLAEDLAQEVFLRVYKSAPFYQPRSLFKVWLYRIAKNVCFNELKARQLRRRLPEPEADGGCPREELIRMERAQYIQKAIEALPERQRLALILRRFQGLSQKETAEIMETSPEAIESLLARAKTRLRSMLADLSP